MWKRDEPWEIPSNVQRSNMLFYHSHRIHGTGIFTHIWFIFMVNVGNNIYINYYMDCLSLILPVSVVIFHFLVRIQASNYQLFRSLFLIAALK